MAHKVLVIDDEELIRRTLEQHLSKEGYLVTATDSAEAGLDVVADDPPDVLLLDNRLPGMSGLALLEKLRISERSIMVIMVTATDEVESAVKAMKLGAYDYISKPFNIDELSLVIRKALEAGSLRKQVKQLRLECRNQVDALIGESAEMIRVKELIVRIAKSDTTTVLIQGESGTGKELVAKALHSGSGRADEPFKAINCAAVPVNLLESELMGHERGAFTDAKTTKKGLFELADGGTVFLDEIGDMPLVMQPKLLRLLEEKTFRRVGGVRDISVDVRVISATNHDLSRAMQEGRFRKDLFYRLQVVPITLPPLRDRGNDIRILADHFIAYFNRECHKNVQALSQEAEQILLDYPWPGNVRELRNVIERAMILDIEDEILPDHLPEEILEARGGSRTEAPIPAFLEGLVIPDEGLSINDVEHALVRKALEMSQGNQTRAAQLLKMPRDAFRRRMKRYGMV
ncbi:MAG TPA: sigma-54 dependent transcriptional regulator [Nitrospirota bacterium]|nr:sigma-54 dependent transcriptional regulator [Nitrospirota bacterium]